MDEKRARVLLSAERSKVESLLEGVTKAGQQDRMAKTEQGEDSDRAEPLNAEGVDDAVAAAMRDKLAALDRAEERLRDHSFGRSIRSGVPIPDERLEADPTAELTVEEAQTKADY